MKIYCGNILNPKKNNTVELIENGALAVNGEGKIEFSGAESEAAKKYRGAEIIRFASSYILPGFIDIHTHLPQYPAVGLGKGELLDWLKTYIFPLEARFSDEAFARKHSEVFFKDVLKNGTTTVVVFCSSQKRAADIAFEEAEKAGIRAFIGKCIMDTGGPEELLSTLEENIGDSLELAQKWHGQDNGRLNYILSPRYAGTCTIKLLENTAELAETETLYIQTHLAENMKEISYIAGLFKGFESYTDVYDKTGLLGSRTILAHCIYLKERGLQALVDNKCKIAHCPTSNVFLNSGIMPLLKIVGKGINVGLGTDVAAGYSLSVMNEARNAIESAKIRSLIDNEQNILSPEAALCMATIGGAETLGIDDIIGSLDVGKDADFIVINAGEFIENELIAEKEAIISRILYTAANNVENVFVRGKSLMSK